MSTLAFFQRGVKFLLRTHLCSRCFQQKTHELNINTKLLPRMRTFFFCIFVLKLGKSRKIQLKNIQNQNIFFHICGSTPSPLAKYPFFFLNLKYLSFSSKLGQYVKREQRGGFTPPHSGSSGGHKTKPLQKLNLYGQAGFCLFVNLTKARDI